MNISIVGTSYVGLVSATCFAELGANVVCVDPTGGKINRLIFGDLPIYEPGLEEMLTHNLNERTLEFSSNVDKAFDDPDVVFCAIDPKLGKDGSTDLEPVLSIARDFGAKIKHYAMFVLKTTVPVGSSQQVKEIIANEIAKRGGNVEFDVATNPDFITEGNAIKDFMNPDRIVIGVDSARARTLFERIYRPILLHNSRVIFTDTRTAEMIKYAATSMLATRISLMNEIANLCEVVGADANVVRQGVGMDSRIGPKYIYPGCGYGGTLFTQDIRDLINIADVNDFNMDVLRAVDQVNNTQKQVMFEKLTSHYSGKLKGKTVALWGLSFKPGTDDMSEGPAIRTLDLLTKAGCEIRVYDPVTMNAAKLKWSHIYCATDMYDAVDGADAVLLITEWSQFHMPDWKRVKGLMATPYIIDGRNIYDAAEVQEYGFDYNCIGK